MTAEEYLDREQEHRLLNRVLKWREEHISQRMFVLILAFMVGLFAAMAAFILHGLINQIVLFLTSSFDSGTANWLYLVYPVLARPTAFWWPMAIGMGIITV